MRKPATGGSQPQTKLNPTFYLICGAAIFTFATIIAIRIHYSTCRKKLELQFDFQGRELRIEYNFLRKVAGVPTKFRLRELEEATDGFHSLIGRGGSGSVYKGILSDDTAITVKQIDGEERGERAFK
ncbi:Protein kinase superfamily protein [Perilla frutescens var. hirtella]|nr:Protein kinase superfamily protein [Perilla frutescens var. hirtella]